MSKYPKPKRNRASDSEIVFRVGQVTRMLRDSIRELGLDQAIAQAAEAIPDAQDRLSYVVQMTAQAAERTLSCVEDAQPRQIKLKSTATTLKRRWEARSANPATPPDDGLVTDTQQYLDQVLQHTACTHKQLSEIVQAQEFQDLTGQVIKRMMDLIQQIEKQLLIVLMDNMPEQRANTHKANDNLLNGPQLNQQGRGAIVNQDQVDDLLDSLKL